MQSLQLQENKDDQRNILETGLKGAQGWMMSTDFRLKQSRLQVKQKHSVGREVKSSCAKKETGDIGIFITSRNNDKKIMQPIRETIRPSTRLRKRNIFSQRKQTSSKVRPTKQTQILTISHAMM